MKGFEFRVAEQGNGVNCTLSPKMIRDCSHSGQCDKDVAYWRERLNKALACISDETIRLCLKPAGAWSDNELLDRDTNLERFLWLAACDASENNTRCVYMQGH